MQRRLVPLEKRAFPHEDLGYGTIFEYLETVTTSYGWVDRYMSPEMNLGVIDKQPARHLVFHVAIECSRHLDEYSVVISSKPHRERFFSTKISLSPEELIETVRDFSDEIEAIIRENQHV